MNVLSLFDGMSCGQIALGKLGIKVDNYFACEIDKYAIKVTMDNFPNTKQLGDVTKVDFKSLPKIDLLIGGSPCQGFSFAGKQLNFEDPRSKLFFEYVRALEEAKPKYFLLENVVMKKEYQDVISEHLGVKPIMINSSLVSAQKRLRYYWTNIPNLKQPENKNIFLRDILDLSTGDIPFNMSSSGKGNGVVENRYYESVKAQTLTASGYSSRSFTGVIQLNPSKEAGNKQPYNQNRVYSIEGKAPALTASFAGRTNILKDDRVRKLSVMECKRLQTIPDNYKMDVSNYQAYKLLGNGWTVDVIAHILKGVSHD